MSKPKGSKVLVIIGAVAAIAVGAIIFVYLPYLSTNHAKDVALPLSETLVQKGGKKVCDEGDGGHGLGGPQPWYTVYYEVGAGREGALRIINDVAATHDFEQESSGDSLTYTRKGTDAATVTFTIKNDGSQTVSCGSKGKTTVDTGAQYSLVTMQVK